MHLDMAQLVSSLDAPNFPAGHRSRGIAGFCYLVKAYYTGSFGNERHTCVGRPWV